MACQTLKVGMKLMPKFVSGHDILDVFNDSKTQKYVHHLEMAQKLGGFEWFNFENFYTICMKIHIVKESL